MVDKLTFVAFREGKHWVGVGIEKFVAAQADSLKELWPAVHRAVAAEIVVAREHRLVPFGRIKKAPKDVQRRMKGAFRIDPTTLDVPKYRIDKVAFGSLVTEELGLQLPALELWVC